MLIATWNVNSIRTRLPHVKDYLKRREPDLLCIQETKVQDHLFPSKDLLEMGYNVSFQGQKSYNGVAIISKDEIEDVRIGFSGELNNEPDLQDIDEQKRLISVLFKGIRVINVYVPNGSSLDSDKYDYKIKWLKFLKEYINKQSLRDEPLCLVGDFNIALEAKDIHSPERLTNGIMASKLEREALRDVLGENLKDAFRMFETESNHWSWWDYRSNGWEADRGWRIDHIYLSKELRNQAKSCFIDKEIRGQSQPSDHAPVVVELEWPSEKEEDEDFDFL